MDRGQFSLYHCVTEWDTLPWEPMTSRTRESMESPGGQALEIRSHGTESTAQGKVTELKVLGEDTDRLTG